MDIEQEYAVVSIDDIQEHPRNPRKGDEEAINASIEASGWYGACTVQKSTGYILAGNHRYRVAKKRGAEKIAVIYKDVDDTTALRVLLADNKTADLGTYDEELVDVLLTDLGNIEGTGYDHILDAADQHEPADTPPVEIDPDRYTPQYAMIVACASETDQKTMYEDLVALRPEWEVKLVAV